MTARAETGALSVKAASPGIRFGDDTLLLTRESEPPSHDAAAGRVLAQLASPDELHLVVQVGRRFEAEHPREEILYRRGRYLVVRISPERAHRLARRGCYTIEPLSPSDTVFRVEPRPTSARARTLDASPLLASLSRERVKLCLEHLVSYGTRHSTGAKFREAAEWTAARFRADGYDVSSQEVTVGSRKSRNVVAERRGTGDDRAAVLVTAHLDSINHEEGVNGAAPGADDNASGAAGVLELAACLARNNSTRDLRFILFGGEEQGLFGSIEYVAALPANPKIHSVLNMDMIASVNGTPTPTVLIEGGAMSRPLMDGLVAAAHEHTGLTVQTSLHYANSDHVPFIDAGIRGVLSIEGTDSANDNVHTARDTTANLDYDLMAEILAMHLAYLGEALGMAPEH